MIKSKYKSNNSVKRSVYVIGEDFWESYLLPAMVYDINNGYEVIIDIATGLEINTFISIMSGLVEDVDYRCTREGIPYPMKYWEGSVFKGGKANPLSLLEIGGVLSYLFWRVNGDGYKLKLSCWISQKTKDKVLDSLPPHLKDHRSSSYLLSDSRKYLNN